MLASQYNVFRMGFGDVFRVFFSCMLLAIQVCFACIFQFFFIEKINKFEGQSRAPGEKDQQAAVVGQGSPQYGREIREILWFAKSPCNTVGVLYQKVATVCGPAICSV